MTLASGLNQQWSIEERSCPASPRIGIVEAPVALVGTRLVANRKLIESHHSRLLISLQQNLFEFPQKGLLIPSIRIAIVGVRLLMTQLQAFEQVIDA